MKIFFLYTVTEKPFGGANQFFKMLKSIFEARGILTNNIEEADVIVFNSHSLGSGKGDVFGTVLSLRRRYPDKVFIHRVDGPVSMYRGEKHLGIDREIYQINTVIADGTVFQSHWSKKENKRLGMSALSHETVIMNAPDLDIFYPGDRVDNSSGRIRIIATSWSHHERKGFDIYRFLDTHIDFTKYDMVFVGNSPVQFNHIRVMPVMTSTELAQTLRESDIFITASINDPCSNALLEALHTGLPAVVRASGGHPEIVGGGGEVFQGTSDVLDVIDRVANNRIGYRTNVTLPDMQQVANAYVNFFEEVLADESRHTLSLMRYVAVSVQCEVSSFVRRLRKVFRLLLKKERNIV